jgi:hypothetical protein
MKDLLKVESPGQNSKTSSSPGVHFKYTGRLDAEVSAIQKHVDVASSHPAQAMRMRSFEAPDYGFSPA